VTTTQTPVHITFQDLEPSPTVEAEIRTRAARLGGHTDRMTDCRVALSRPRRRGRHGHLYQVRIEIALAGDQGVVVSREPGRDRAHEDVHVAIRDAFDAARRQLHDHVERRHRP
jgi:ribosome-associated translation inhibitor RaiA